MNYFVVCFYRDKFRKNMRHINKNWFEWRVYSSNLSKFAAKIRHELND